MAFEVTPPTPRHLETFRLTLWKERRRLQMRTAPAGTRVLRKYFAGDTEVAAEIRWLRAVSDALGVAAIPEIVAIGPDYVDLRYVEGSRVYNVFELLRALENEADAPPEVRRQLLLRCVRSTSAVQRVLAATGSPDGERAAGPVYPLHAKLMTLFELFHHALRLPLELDALSAELRWAESFMARCRELVPFRDAAPKNLILAWPAVWLGRVTASEQRQLVDAQIRDHGAAGLQDVPIVHVDFSGCQEYTLPEDDPISLLLHESTWLGRQPAPEELLWLPVAPDPVRLAVALVVRLYRLGGRRLSYRLVHCGGHAARYAQEDSGFYLRQLLISAEQICPQLTTCFPRTLAATSAILDRLDQGLHTARDWFQDSYSPARERYYRDLFPH